MVKAHNRRLLCLRLKFSLLGPQFRLFGLLLHLDLLEDLRLHGRRTVEAEEEGVTNMRGKGLGLSGGSWQRRQPNHRRQSRHRRDARSW